MKHIDGLIIIGNIASQKDALAGKSKVEHMASWTEDIKNFLSIVIQATDDSERIHRKGLNEVYSLYIKWKTVMPHIYHPHLEQIWTWIKLVLWQTSENFRSSPDRYYKIQTTQGQTFHTCTLRVISPPICKELQRVAERNIWLHDQSSAFTKWLQYLAENSCFFYCQIIVLGNF